MNKLTLKKILLVEDDPDIATIIKIALEKLGGYDVKICYDGLTAFNLIQDLNPDLILMDVMMPEMDGTEILIKIRQNNISKIPVIFLTAKVQPRDIEFYKNIGALDVIAKPFDPMKIHEQIENIWNSFKNHPL